MKKIYIIIVWFGFMVHAFEDMESIFNFDLFN